MIANVHDLMVEFSALPTEDRLKLARMLIDSAIETLPAVEPILASESNMQPRGLAALAGRFSGGSGNSAENAEAILEASVDSVYGLSVP